MSVLELTPPGKDTPIKTFNRQNSISAGSRSSLPIVGSNGFRVHLWNRELQAFDNDTGLSASKWNRIEPRLFAFITQNWRGKLLISHEVIRQLIESTPGNQAWGAVLPPQE